MSINNHGQVAGYLYNLGENFRGFIWTPETGTVMLPRPAGIVSMQIHDLNDLGHAVGELQEVPTLGKVPIFWDGQQIVQIQMPAGSINGHAWSLNNLDQVVGQYETPTGVRAFLWVDGVFTDLSERFGLGATAIPSAIDDRSRISGHMAVGNAITHAFIIDSSDFSWLAEPPPLISTTCSEISNGEFAAGWGSAFEPADPNTFGSGIIWTPTATFVLSTGIPRLHIVLSGANESGRVVGGRGRGNFAPLVWQGGQTTDLYDLMSPPPDSRGRAWAGTKINRTGQIAFAPTEGSLKGTLVLTPQWLPGDLTGDCRVTLGDLAILLSHFGSPAGAYPTGDVDGDGDVDLPDLAILLTHFGE